MYRLFILLSSLAAFLLFSPQGWADDDTAPISNRKKAKKKQNTERNVRKAASNKRKALREMGVKNVRVKAPGDWPRKVAVPEDTELQEQPLPAVAKPAME